MKSKFCSGCEKDLDLSNFSKRSASKDGLSSRCKLCVKAYKAKYQQDNADKLKKKKRAYYLNNRDDILIKTKVYAQENKDKLNKAKQVWRARNPDKVREMNEKHLSKHIDKRRKSRREWNIRNPEKVNESLAFRRALKKSATIFNDLKTRKKMRSFYKKAKELSMKTGLVYEVDHIIPLQSGEVCGLHVPWNLRVVPRHINRRKSNKLEYLA